MRKVYFQNEHTTIIYNKEASLGTVTCHGEVIGTDFREAILICLDMIDRFELKCLIGDNSKCKAIASADLEWCQEVLLPQLALGPVLKVALLLSQSEARHGVIELVVDKENSMGQKLFIRSLPDETEALAWFMEPG
ncbi:hypothetical protein ACFSKU_17140 [Pontibacter silvestris]|uniref:SpoIIAA-like n=1 Tax=Pontibacter silvestris TaxID=2305183 RepID=A0ABW4X121_9BACT|nr:hypothetical protein [Pontibacter silvestris]MCC9135749.1 hypothetical protein [Pontibacter silvestris]